MAVTWDRVLAILISVGWAIAAGSSDRSLWTGLLTLVVLSLPVGLICFADDLGRGPRDPGPKLTVLGYYARRRWCGTGADRPSPPAMLVAVGWLLLVGLPIVILLLKRRAEQAG
jgi:hypothetical protein